MTPNQELISSAFFIGRLDFADPRELPGFHLRKPCKTGRLAPIPLQKQNAISQTKNR
jgi:hypothetical protein